MKYFTAKGDTGTTRLFNCPEGIRLSKGEAVFEVLGGVDELNSFVGWCRAVAERSSFEGAKRREFLNALLAVQEALFLLQAKLGGGTMRLSEAHVRRLEKGIARFSGEFPAIHSFIIPGATELGGLLDVCRAIARRVERLYVQTEQKTRGDASDDALIVAYLNRLSSLLYVLARYTNYAHNVPEQPPSYK